jgi:hypothetical protein
MEFIAAIPLPVTVSITPFFNANPNPQGIPHTQVTIPPSHNDLSIPPPTPIARHKIQEKCDINTTPFPN